MINNMKTLNTPTQAMVVELFIAIELMLVAEAWVN